MNRLLIVIGIVIVLGTLWLVGFFNMIDVVGFYHWINLESLLLLWIVVPLVFESRSWLLDNKKTIVYTMTRIACHLLLLRLCGYGDALQDLGHVILLVIDPSSLHHTLLSLFTALDLLLATPLLLHSIILFIPLTALPFIHDTLLLLYRKSVALTHTTVSFLLIPFCLLLDSFPHLINPLALLVDYLHFRLVSPFSRGKRDPSDTQSAFDRMEDDYLDASVGGSAMVASDGKSDDVIGNEKDGIMIEGDEKQGEESMREATVGEEVHFWLGGNFGKMLGEMASEASANAGAWMRRCAEYVDSLGLRQRLLGRQFRRAFTHFITQTFKHPIRLMQDQASSENVRFVELIYNVLYSSAALVHLVVFPSGYQPNSASFSLINLERACTVLLSADICHTLPLIVTPPGSTILVAADERIDEVDQGFTHWRWVVEEQGGAVEFVGQVDVSRVWEIMVADSALQSQSSIQADLADLDDLRQRIRAVQSAGSTGSSMSGGEPVEEDADDGSGDGEAYEGDEEEEVEEVEEEEEGTSGRSASGTSAGVFEDDFY